MVITGPSKKSWIKWSFSVKHTFFIIILNVLLISNTPYKEQPDNTRLYYMNAVNIQALTSRVIHRIRK
jgi:hypothetical protein